MVTTMKSLLTLKHLQTPLILGLCLCVSLACSSTKKDLDWDDEVQSEGIDLTLGARFEERTLIAEVHFENIYFTYDSFTVNTTHMATIERVADYMTAHRACKLVVEGHCDERGSREYNLSLGEHRSHGVRAYLMGLRVDGDRIQTRSYGEERPVRLGHDDASWRLNRRVEFLLFK